MYYCGYAVLWIAKRERSARVRRKKSFTLKSHKARSCEKPFIEFTNSVHLTKSCGSGLLLNILTDLSIIDRPILISYVSIATTRTYKVGHVGSLCVPTYVCTCSPTWKCAPSFSSCPLFSSTSAYVSVFPPRDHKKRTKLIKETWKIIRCMPRHVSRWHTTQEWLY